MVSKKTKPIALFMLIATVLCAVIAAIAGAFGIGANVQTANATATGTDLGVLGVGGNFNATNLTSLMGKIMGSPTAKSYNELKAYMDKDSNNVRNSNEINAQVTLYGYKWNVVYASETKGGDIIATLWLAEISDVQQWNVWYSSVSSTWDFPSNMYSTSYARSYLTASLFARSNTGGAISDAESVYLSKGLQSQTWKTFIESYNDFISTPSEVAWQETESGALMGYGYTYSNEAYGVPASQNWSSANYDYSKKDGYGDWRYDKLWLPSLSETGDNIDAEKTGNAGVWRLSAPIRKNSRKTALRTARASDSVAMFHLTEDGVVSGDYVSESYAIRPAFHLNLKKAASAAGLIVEAPTFREHATDKAFALSNGNTVATATYTPGSLNFYLTDTTNIELALNGTTFTAAGGVFKGGVGTHVISMNPKAGYGWSDGSVGAKNLNIVITPYTITQINWSSTATSFAYTGSPINVTATGVGVSLANVFMPVLITGDNVNTGTFTARAYNIDSNYVLDSKLNTSKTITITKAQITANDVEWSFLEGAKFATGAQPQITALYRFNGKAYQLSTSITATSGSTTDWTAGDYTATATLPATGMENFALTGTATRNFLLSETANGNYTVIWEGFSLVATYNGANQTPTAYIISDGEKLAATVTVEKWDGMAWTAATSAKDAGEYRFTATRTNYTLSNDKVECRIDPRVISVDYANLTGLIHGAVDGNNDPVKVTATTGDPVPKAEIEKGELNLAVTGGSNLAGTHLVSVAAQVKDGSDWTACTNYIISNATAVQTVNKKVLTDNDITWTPNGLNFTYDGNIKIPAGTVKTAALTGGDTGSVYVIFEFVYAVEVGSYQVKVLGLSNDNYAYSGFKTVTIVADGSQSVQWEGVQNGGSVRYNGGNQLPKPYIVIGGEKVYLEIDSLTRDGADVSDKTAAIIAGEYVAKVNEVTSGNYQFGEATVTFTIAPMELKAIYLTQNVFIYSGSNPVIEVYALGANNEKIVIYNRTVTVDGASASLTDYSDAGNYAVTVASGVLSSNSNYTFASSLTTTFAVNPMTVEVTFITAGNNWIWQDGKNSEITVTASVPNSVKVNYGNFGAVNADVADNGSGTFVIAANSMTSLNGKGMISVTTVNGNYQISGQSFRTFDIVSSETTATAEFEFDGKAWTDDNVKLTYGDSRAIAVSGSDGVEVKYYKDGVLLTSPVTDTASLDAGNYLITVSCATREVKTNINALSRSFIILPKEVDLSSANWVINGNAVAGNAVAYNGQIYSATLDLGENADGFAVYYTNGASKNVGSVTTRATVVPKNGNYKAVGVTDSYNWTITDVAATVSWNNDGTVASISGDNAAATGGSFFVKDGASYKVVYKKDGVVLDKAPTEDGDYTAEVVLALGNDGNVKVTANSFSFTISGGSGIGGGDTPAAGGISWWWIALIVIASLALFFALVAVFIAVRKKNAVAGDDDGFYDDVTDEDLM